MALRSASWNEGAISNAGLVGRAVLLVLRRGVLPETPGEEAGRLRVVQERSDDRRVQRIGRLGHRRHVVRHDRPRHRAENHHARSSPSQTASVVCKNVGHTNW